jgi:hypothetical protein
METIEKRSIKLLVKLWGIVSCICAINYILLVSIWGILKIEGSDHTILLICGIIMLISGIITDDLKNRNIIKLNE